MPQRKKKLLLAVAAVGIAAVVIFLTAFLSEDRKAQMLKTDYAYLQNDPAYARAVLVEGVEPVTQNVSCGYAVLEMFADWAGKDVSEAHLLESRGEVTTSTGGGFVREMNELFPEYATVMHPYMPDDELLQLIYASLQDGIPVPVEWAAAHDGEWTLHYSLIVGLDLPGDAVTVVNPYGYTETLTTEEFLQRTSLEAYENMPLFLRFGLAFGLFERNTIFIASSADEVSAV